MRLEVLHSYSQQATQHQWRGLYSFQSWVLVDHLGQRHPLDMEIPNFRESSFNILSSTHMKRYNMILNTQFGPDVLIIPGLPSQVTGIWADWHLWSGWVSCRVCDVGSGHTCHAHVSC